MHDVKNKIRDHDLAIFHPFRQDPVLAGKIPLLIPFTGQRDSPAHAANEARQDGTKKIISSLRVQHGAACCLHVPQTTRQSLYPIPSETGAPRNERCGTKDVSSSYSHRTRKKGEKEP
jgi:hypothetical protein